jgi:hypothetical protein
MYKILDVIIRQPTIKKIRYKKCNDEIFFITLYIVYCIKCNYTYNINILNIIL